MKICEILEPKIDMEKLSPIIEKIKENCQPFLKQSRGKPLLRGVTPQDKISSDIPLFSEESIRLDRKPRNSGYQPFFNWSFNSIIQEKFNIPTVRYRSLFCSGSFGTARYYGIPAFIFPKGNFKFLWSPSVNDSLDDITSVAKWYRRLFQTVIQDSESEMNFQKWKYDVLDPFINELITDEDYNLKSMLRLDDPILDEIYKVIYDDFKQYKMTQLSTAINTGNEIFLIGPQEYYSISVHGLSYEMNIPFSSKDYGRMYSEFLRLVNS